MKKYILTICWLLIVIGVVYIASHRSKPEPSIENPVEEEAEVVEEVTPEPEEIPEPVIEVEDKSFFEHIAAGDQFMQGFFYESAIAEYLAAAKLNPRSVDALSKLANAYLANNEPEKAKSTYEAALVLQPDSAHIKLGIVRSYLALRDQAGAKSILNQLDANDYDVKFFAAVISIIENNTDHARDLFQDIVDNAPESYQVSRGNALNFLDKYNTFGFFTEADPIQLKTLLAKGMTETGLYESAIPVLFDVINQKNNYRDAWLVLGYAYLNTGKNQDAIDAFKQAKGLDPENAVASFFLGLSYYASNEYDKAILFIEKADELGYQPKTDLDLKLGELYLIKEEYQQSATRYEKYLALNPYDLGLYIRTIYLNIDKLNKPDKALLLAQQAIQYHPNAAMSYNLLGWAQIASGDYEIAEKNLEKAMNMDPDLESTYYNLGLLYEEKGLRIVALEYYKKAYTVGDGSVMGNKAAQRFNELNNNKKSKLIQVNTLNYFN